MKDRLFFCLLASTAVASIGLAAIWPQGFGARSPAPFGHALLQPPDPPPAQKAKPPLPASATQALETPAALAAGLRVAR